VSGSLVHFLCSFSGEDWTRSDLFGASNTFIAPGLAHTTSGTNHSKDRRALPSWQQRRREQLDFRMNQSIPKDETKL